VTQPGVLAFGRRSLAVAAGLGALSPGEGGQAKPVEQLGSLFMEHGGPIMGRGRPEVSGFNARHDPRLRP
jgi:hypothetical protein